MSAHPDQKITPEEYLRLERAAEFKSEYYGGYMYAMSGASYVHSVVKGNLEAELRVSLKKRGCAVFSSDLRVLVSPTGLYTYPDVLVVCGTPQFADAQRDTLTNPVVIVEILSPSTELHDRDFKARQYKTVASVQEYVLVSQKEPRVEVHQRQGSGKWVLSDFSGLDAVCRFESLDCAIPLTAIYDSVAFEEVPPQLLP
jgi:Uma2 family endonuclease